MENWRTCCAFRGKTWIFTAQALVFGGLSAFALIMGPLFLLEILRRADGRPGTEAGVALLVLSPALVLVTILAVFNVRARRRPILRVCREGLVARRIGGQTVEGSPWVSLVPRLLLVLWLVLSGRGFRQQLLAAPWEHFESVEVSGPPLERQITIVAAFFPVPPDPGRPNLPAADWLQFQQVDFADPLDQIASAIRSEFSHRNGPGGCN